MSKRDGWHGRLETRCFHCLPLPACLRLGVKAAEGSIFPVNSFRGAPWAFRHGVWWGCSRSAIGHSRITSMLTRLRVAVVAAIIVLTTPATAQKITAEGIARAASIYAAIVEFCPSTQRVNVELATKAVKAMTDAANEALGPDVGRTTLNNELKRRFDEVRVKGAVVWCANQARQPANAPLFGLTRR
jgi:hypothetical protein